MSFNFDGGDDTDDDLDLDAYDDTGLLALAARRERGGGVGKSTSTTSAADADMVAVAAAAVGGGIDGGTTENVDMDAELNEEDWDNDIDWEDADQTDEGGEHEDDDASQHHFPTRGVMINIGKSVGKSNHPEDDHPIPIDDEKVGQGKDEDACNPPSSKKRKRKSTIRVLRNVPPETQRLILNIRRTQLLCNVARSVQCSFVACGGGGSIIHGNDDSESNDYDRLLVAHVAYSLIPQEFIATPISRTTPTHRESKYTIPTIHELRRFSQWSFQFLNQCGERRRAALQRNVAHGASATIASPDSRQRTRRVPGNVGTKQQSRENQRTPSLESLRSQNACRHHQTITNPHSDLLQKVMYLAPHYDEDPQLLIEEEGTDVDAIDAVERITPHDKALMFLTMARYVCVNVDISSGGRVF